MKISSDKVIFAGVASLFIGISVMLLVKNILIAFCVAQAAYWSFRALD